MGKATDNKQKKRESLLDSAFSLFVDNGFHKTSISDIVNNAGVAKGTFYLYFKDKYDIRNHLIAHKGNRIFVIAYNELMAHPEITQFEEQVLFMIDHILNQFANDLNLVRLISKHLSWGFFKDSLYFVPSDGALSVFEIYENLLEDSDCKYHSPELMMYTIIELISGTSYNVLLYQQPVSLEELKPHLYETVRGILKQYQIR